MTEPALLAAVVQATSDCTDLTAALHRVGQLLTRRADWVLVDRLEPPDLITRVAAYDADGPLSLPAGMGPASSRRSGAASIGLLRELTTTPGRMLTLDTTALQQITASEDQHRARQARTALDLGTRELLVVGLVARDDVLGVLSLGSRGVFDPDAVAELVDVAAHLSVVLDAARLLTVRRSVATAMQTHLLPPVPSVTGLQLAARYLPAARELDVGGDWYDAFPIGGDLLAVIGDASGHDVTAAARMADLRNLLRAHAVDRDDTPAALLARLGRSAAALDLDATATCTVGRLSPQAAGGWRLVWANAGHLPPVLLRAGRAHLLETSPELMLGVETDAQRTDHVHDLAPGDLLLLYTDGLVESRAQLLDDSLEVLRSTVERLAGASPDQLADHLLTTLAGEATDDVALLVVAVQPAP